MDTPRATLQAKTEFTELAACLGRANAAKTILEMAEWFTSHRNSIDTAEGLASVPSLDVVTAALAIHASPGGDGDPIIGTNGMLRVVTRFNGEGEMGRNRLTDGRIAAARVIGQGDHSAYLGVVELSRSLCRPREPLCHECPLRKWCVSGNANIRRQPSLF